MITEKPLHIVGLTVENIKRLSAVSITPDGNTIILGGKNAQGKSSVLDAIEMALTGKKCDMPVRTGAESGRVVADLGELVVTRTFNPDGGGSLAVKMADGKKVSSPQGVLDALFGRIAFDPLAFTRMKPKDQLETLREIVGVSTALLDSSRQAKYEERTGVNRHVAAVKAQIAKLPFHEDAPKEPLSALELSAQIKAANAANAARARAESALTRSRDELTRMTSHRADIVRQIEKLQTDLEMADEALRDIEGEIAEGKKNVEAMPTHDVSGLAAQLDQIAALNRKHDENEIRADAERALAGHEATSIALTNAITDIDERKRKKLEEAKYPVPGLRLSDDGILYNNVPFEQASAAEQLRVSVGIALAANPRLRVMLVRDGALMDESSLALMQQMAEEAGAQVWIERVGKGDECSIIIEDGQIAEAHP